MAHSKVFMCELVIVKSVLTNPAKLVALFTTSKGTVTKKYGMVDLKSYIKVQTRRFHSIQKEKQNAQK